MDIKWRHFLAIIFLVICFIAMSLINYFYSVEMVHYDLWGCIFSVIIFIIIMFFLFLKQIRQVIDEKFMEKIVTLFLFICASLFLSYLTYVSLYEGASIKDSPEQKEYTFQLDFRRGNPENILISDFNLNCSFTQQSKCILSFLINLVNNSTQTPFEIDFPEQLSIESFEFRNKSGVLLTPDFESIVDEHVGWKRISFLNLNKSLDGYYFNSTFVGDSNFYPNCLLKFYVFADRIKGKQQNLINFDLGDYECKEQCYHSLLQNTIVYRFGNSIKVDEYNSSHSILQDAIIVNTYNVVERSKKENYENIRVSLLVANILLLLTEILRRFTLIIANWVSKFRNS
jgi:hypothetical protein